jgi:hypothetical protein
LAFKKKLYQYHPQREIAHVDTYRTKHKIQVEPADPASLERGVRQLLADKISGDMVGLWLLVPEHLRLGTWDLLGRWSGQATPRVEPRLALQLVHEAALCVTGIRQSRCLSQKGFELLNGLPFVATDQAMHDVLEAHTVAEAEALQKALGWLRRARGHFSGDSCWPLIPIASVAIVSARCVAIAVMKPLAPSKSLRPSSVWTSTLTNPSALPAPPQPSLSLRQLRSCSVWQLTS